MIRRPPRSTLFPYRRSSDLGEATVKTSAGACEVLRFSKIRRRSSSIPFSRSTNFKRALSLFLRLRSEEHTSELQSRGHLVCRLLLKKKNKYVGIVLT